MESMKALILTIIELNLVSKDLFFYWTVIFTELSKLQAIFSSFHR